MVSASLRTSSARLVIQRIQDSRKEKKVTHDVIFGTEEKNQKPIRYDSRDCPVQGHEFNFDVGPFQLRIFSDSMILSCHMDGAA